MKQKKNKRSEGKALISVKTSKLKIHVCIVFGNKLI